MQNINLSTAENSSKGQLGNGGLWALFVILMLTLLLYGGLYLYRNKLNTDIQALKAATTEEKAKLKDDKTKEMVDFNNRAVVAKGLLAEERNVQESLMEIEKLMIDGVYLVSFEYDRAAQSISLVGASNNFNSVAKQLLSFKNSPYFSEVSGGQSKLNENSGMVEFDVVMKFKK